MVPLQEWVCDTCGDLIEKPEDGWLEWVSVDGKVQSYRICHHQTASPKGGDEGCYRHGNHPDLRDNHLEYFLGADGLVALLAEVHVGTFHDPQGEDATELGDHVSWAETVRRLHVPHYEEARRYFTQAQEDGFLDQPNEVHVFSQGNLKAIIEKYGD